MQVKRRDLLKGLSLGSVAVFLGITNVPAKELDSLSLPPVHTPPNEHYDAVMISATDRYSGADVGIVPVMIHGTKYCSGSFCPFHNPSKHKMRYWEKHIRLDKFGLTERKCKHGVRHPDPDSVSFYDTVNIDMRGHICDCGCCI